jgi:hypothetical protein
MVTDLLLSSSVLAWLLDTNAHNSSTNAAAALTQRFRELIALPRCCKCVRGGALPCDRLQAVSEIVYHLNRT